MKLSIQKIKFLDEYHAKKMFDWESDSENNFYCGPCKDPNASPRYKTWQDLQASANTSNAHRFGIYDGAEFVGDFNFIFNHPVQLKNEPKTAWIGIGIGEVSYRGKGLGTLAMTAIEREVKELGGKRIELGVFAFNTPAISFYEKLGYKRFAEIPNFTWWQNKWWSDFRYEKFL